MVDQEMLEAIGQMMDTRLEKALQPVQERLDKIQEDIDILKEDTRVLKDDVDILKEDSAITREATNNLLDWAEKAQIQVQIPLFNKAE